MLKSVKFSLFFCISVLLLSFLMASSGQANAQTSLSVTFSVGETGLLVAGHASPNAQVVIAENGSVIGTIDADERGAFTKNFSALSAGIHELDVYATAENGDKTSTVTYSIAVIEFQETQVTNILLPPTLNVDVTDTSIKVSGISVPNATISIYVNSKLKATTSSSENGKWSKSFMLSEFANIETLSFSVTVAYNGNESEKSRHELIDISGTLDLTQKQSQETETTVLIENVSIGRLFVGKFDLDRDGTISDDELYNVIKGWRDAFYTDNTANCDISGDSYCDITDFSVLLFNIY